MINNPTLLGAVDPRSISATPTPTCKMVGNTYYADFQLIVPNTERAHMIFMEVADVNDALWWQPIDLDEPEVCGSVNVSVQRAFSCGPGH